jgi:hypothetical protein
MATSKAGGQRRYAPLGAYLRNLPVQQKSVTLTFPEIETIIGGALPPSALSHLHQFWSNQKSGSYAPHWEAAGFKVDGVSAKSLSVHFVRTTAPARPPRPLTLQQVLTEVNEAARSHRIEGLQEWRRERHGLSKSPSATLFHKAPKPNRKYAFHVGGLSELQFNVGFESQNGKDVFRHGVAFSLQTTREMPTIEPLVPKIARFNEYFRLYPDAFQGLQMWHWLRKTGRSENAPVAEIPAELIKAGMFIFIGAVQNPNAIEIDWILDDFDRLLPLYQYVEGSERDTFPRLTSKKKGFVFTPGNKNRVPRTAYTREAASVDKSLRHNIVQAALFEHLEGIHGADNTSGEQDPGNGTSVDVAVREGRGYTYYELKTGLSAQSCIRKAIGQLMEYSFWPGSQQADKLVVVGEPAFDKEAKSYIARLRKEFSLPLEYRQFDMKAKKLV